MNFTLGNADLGILLLRVVVGVFFAISGWHKLFNKQRHESLVATLVADGVPFIRINQWFVPTIELGSGLLLVVGLATPVSAMALIFICMVACAVDGIPRITAKYHPIDRADWLDDVLYLPEVLYLVMLAVVLLHGPGKYSIDNVLF